MRVPLPARHQRWFTDRPVAVKVLTAVGTTAVVAATVGVVGIQSVGATHDETAAVSEHDMAGAADLAEARLAMTESQLDVTSHVGSLDPQSSCSGPTGSPPQRRRSTARWPPTRSTPAPVTTG